MKQTLETILVFLHNSLGGGKHRTGSDYAPLTLVQVLGNLGFAVMVVIILAIMAFLQIVGMNAD